MKIVKEHAFVICILLALSAASLPAQKPAPQKFNDAIKRSEAAAELIGKLAQLSQNGIPKELIDKAEAIGVFPCRKTDLLIEHAVLCPGAISRHVQTGWTLPAFYRFGGGGFGRPDPALADSSAMILLFMDNESVSWLDKPIQLDGEKAAVAGPVGPMTVEQKAHLMNAQIIAYSYRKNGLLGRDLTGGFLKAIGLNQDNHINQGLYHMRGREVLAGKEISSNLLPAGISVFQQALQKYYSR